MKYEEENERVEGSTKQAPEEHLVREELVSRPSFVQLWDFDRCTVRYILLKNADSKNGKRREHHVVNGDEDRIEERLQHDIRIDFIARADEIQTCADHPL